MLDTEGSSSKSDEFLIDTICSMRGSPRASFHMPGHKSRLGFVSSGGLRPGVFDLDVTELAGLDDLTDPVSLIKKLESDFAQLYGVKRTFLSLGGSSHGLIASLLALSSKPGFVLVPRNAHRSILNGLILSGHQIVWYEPEWDSEWAQWGAVSPDSLQDVLKSQKMTECVAMVVVSPTYGGAMSNIRAVKDSLSGFGEIPLIVDEAHGAHLLPLTQGLGYPSSAVTQGADLVVHSLHKTMPGLTQTGLIHIPQGSLLAAESIKASLRLVTSSSPSYPLMVSMELVARLCKDRQIGSLFEQLLLSCGQVKEAVLNSESLEFYEPGLLADPFHLLVKSKVMNSFELCEFFESKGVFVEGNIGNGTLLLVGLGTESGDIESLASCVSELSKVKQGKSTGAINPTVPVRLEQVISPREAFLSDFEIVPIGDAEGRISAECLSPCPPGIPVVSPGAYVPSGLESSDCLVRGVRVVK